ncbi:unnamed protein product, partial [Scytosiphon promiscuus]
NQVQTGGGHGDDGAWLANARALLGQAPSTLPPGSCYLSLLRWAIAVGETSGILRAATTGGAISFNESRPALSNMEPLAERGRPLLLGGTGVVTLLAAVGIAPPAGVASATPASPSPAAPLGLRLGDGPLSALSTIETVARGVDACRQWTASAKTLVSGLDGASPIRLVQELQANRQLPYAVDGGGLRSTLAHELSLKAPEHPELAHHLGSVGGAFGATTGGDEDDDGMSGAIDMNDAGWASNGDLDGSAAIARAAGLQTASLARAVPPPLFTNTAAPTTRGSRNQRTSPFNLKACSACKKGRTSAIKCRVDNQHWEDPDWTDPPSRPWVMPDGFVEWIAKRTRCLVPGCNNPVGRDVAFCSDDCVVAAQKQAMQALTAFHQKQRGGAADAGPALPLPEWTPEDEEAFAKGLEAVRARSAQTAGQRFRHKVMDRFRELFSEGMAELGVDPGEAVVLSGVLAWDLEHELNAFSPTNRGVYKEKAQSLRFNIKFAKNPELFKDLLTGGTSMKTLCGMSTDELASSHLKEERKRIRDESYAGHLRQEDEGNEIVYKDGALQKITSVKSDAKKQVRSDHSLAPGPEQDNSLRRGSDASVKKARRVSGGGGGGMVKMEDGGATRSELLKRKLSARDIEEGQGSASKRIKRLLAVGSPIIGDVPKLEFPSSLPEFPSSPLDLDKIPSPPGAGNDSDDPDGGGLKTMDIDGGGGDEMDLDGGGKSRASSSSSSGGSRKWGSGDGGDGDGDGPRRLSSPMSSPVPEKEDDLGQEADNGLSEPSFAVGDDDEDDDDNDDMEIEEDDEEDEEEERKAKERKASRSSSSSSSFSSGPPARPITPPPEVPGMTRIAPKLGKSRRPAKSENFAINEPGREPFYVHAYHEGNPDQCADLQALLPRNLDVDGRVSMTNLNGTMKSRAQGSIRVLVLRPGGGGPNNPNVLNRFCQDFATYKNQGRAGYCFKQFDKKHVEFLYLVPPALAQQVPLIAQNPAAQGHLVCLVVTVASAAVAVPAPPPAPAPAPMVPPPPPQQPQPQYHYRPAPPTFAPSSPVQQQQPPP